MPVIIKIHPIRPEENFMTKIFGTYEARIAATLRRKVGPMLQREMAKRTQGWDTKITFKSTVRVQKTQIRLDVVPFGRGKSVWTYVTAGTSRHSIAPVNYPFLSIKKGYSPHTGVGNVYGGPGSYGGPFYRVYGSVDHPGYEGRKFEDHIVRDKRDDVVRTIQAAARGLF